MTPTPIPELPHTCNSWVVTSPDGSRRHELWTRANVEKAAAAGWRIETAHAYLCRINAEIKAATNA